MKDKVSVAATLPTPKPISYPIAVVAGSKQASEAKAFAAFVQSAEGRGILAGFGFEAP
jgi:molybdate transport system substrate-binding protein